MVGELYAGYKGFSALVGLGQQFLQVKDAATRNTLVFEFTAKLLEAQQHEALLIERISELEKRLVQFENWETQKQRYELSKLDTGTFIYRLKQGMEDGEPSHEICAKCYNTGKKSVLQPNVYTPGRANVLECHECGSVIYIDGTASPEHQKMRPKT